MRKTWKSNRVDISLIPEVEIARLAAFIDGEGSISLQASGSARRSAFCAVRLTIAQANMELMEYLLNTFGGRYEQGQGGTNRPMYYWLCGSHYACFLLRRCLPWLIVKRTQAEVALEYQSTIDSNNRRALPDELVTRRTNLKNKLTLLKHPERAEA
jgi:hypothetical protein